jgi:outer membrane protein assembly factor BamB
VAGIRAGDGALLWSTDAWKTSIATIPTPVPLGGDRLLLAGGYNSGAAVLRVTRRGDTFLAEVLYRLPAGVFGADMQTPVLREGFVYGIRPGGELVCMDPAEGTIRWSSGPAHRFGLGPFTAADGKLYVMDDAGQLTMARLTPTGFKPLASTRILAGPDAWGPMAVAGGRLIARDLTRMVCVDIGRDAR